MPELDLTWKRVIAIWWLIVWRGSVGTFLLGAVLVALNGIAGIILRWPPGTTRQINIFLASLASLAAGIIVVRMALRKRYRDFRLGIVARDEDGDGLGPLADGDLRSRREPKF